MSIHRRTALAAAVAATTLALAGCATATSTSDAASDTAVTDGGDLVFAIGNDPISLNPSGTGSGNDTIVQPGCTLSPI